MNSDRFTCDSFARKHGLTILLPFTSQGFMDAEGALLADRELLLHVGYGRGGAMAYVAPIISPMDWYPVDEVRRLFRLGPPPPSTVTVNITSFQDAVSFALEQADEIMPFFRKQFQDGDRYWDFVREFHKLRRATSSTSSEEPPNS